MKLKVPNNGNVEHVRVECGGVNFCLCPYESPPPFLLSFAKLWRFHWIKNALKLYMICKLTWFYYFILVNENMNLILTILLCLVFIRSYLKIAILSSGTLSIIRRVLPTCGYITYC
jgi:hypothetical protein